MLRVLIYCMNYGPEIAGVGRYTGELGEFISQHCRLEVITTIPHYPGWTALEGYRNWFSVDQDRDARVFRCPLLLNKDMGGIWRLLAPFTFAINSTPIAIWRILGTRPDVVLFVEPTLFVAPVGLLMAKLMKARTILHVQDLEIDAAFAVGHLAALRWLKWLATKFERWCLRRFDHVVTISHKMAHQIQAKGVAQDRLFVIRNWVDLDKIRPSETELSYRDELGLPRAAYIVLYSGNVGPKQGLSLVVESARLLREKPNIIFVIAGEGPSKHSLIGQAAGLDNVRFLSFQPNEKLGRFMNICDLHILPQLAATSDMVLPSKLGAMLASGRPIVVTTQTDTELAQFLGNAVRIVPPGNPIALAQAVLACANGDGQESVEERLRLATELSHHGAMDNFRRILFLAHEALQAAAN